MLPTVCVLVAFAVTTLHAGEIGKGYYFNKPYHSAIYYQETLPLGGYSLVTDPDNMDMKCQMNHEKMSYSRSIGRYSRQKDYEATFVFGEEFESNLLDGRRVNNTIHAVSPTTENNQAKQYLRVIKMNGFESTQELSFGTSYKEGLTVTLKAKDATAILKFERWNPNDHFGGKGMFYSFAEVKGGFFAQPHTGNRTEHPSHYHPNSNQKGF